jgi:uncharacterized protein YcaQ
VYRLTKAQARRIAVRAQLLDARRPTDLLTVVRQLTLLQIDPTAAIAPSADLVAWSRLGSTYRSDDLQEALEQDRTLFEHNALVRPMGDLGLYLAASRTSRSHERTHAWIRDNDRFRRDILELLGSSGPLSSRDIPDTCVVPWASTGWTNNRNVTQMLLLAHLTLSYFFARAHRLTFALLQGLFRFPTRHTLLAAVFFGAFTGALKASLD